ncbi:MORC family CW-type zinc finger protein 3a [Nerophis lumbriciformis]|uniref:MORC family CW-type zinc finger protein 3a n=1 Tax=Nerophis lumbriciformis TaxID=546530 RepID=UPI002AE08681|nr:MORC family CW-type zinc finger protein 3-like isoform X1 [Nerophis lumbriciformis]
MAAHPDRGVPLSTLCPKFLHTNSTSHTWPFSAIAELIDNACDPDVLAKQFWIDKTIIQESECLTFMDNGNGLDHEGMHKMLSFGYSEKVAVNGIQPIGMYGNGFKSGSMRLGKDAIVFSKSNNTSCVGMLSQTYLEKINSQQIIVPIACFEHTSQKIMRVREEHKASLKDILHYSPFKTESDLLTEISAISSTWSHTTTGTRIIIWNLRRTSTGTLEFDFHNDRYDIQIPSDVYEGLNQPGERIPSHIPQSVYSLRAYCSILYLKPHMQVVIRGQKVKTQLIAKSLAQSKKDHYKPNFLNKRVPIIFGYNTRSKDHYGIMMYHKNRLIKAYERIGCQLRPNSKGVGVIGVIECNFLDPTHNKQSFIETDKYRRAMISLAIKLDEYCNQIHFNMNTSNPGRSMADICKGPDQNWVQCDSCQKWRKLPDGIDCSRLPDSWFCHMNPEPQFRSCEVMEEPEDSDDDQPSYRKTYKQKEREDKMKLTRKSMTGHSPSTTSRSTIKVETPKTSVFAPLVTILSPSASSPSCSSGFPIISHVCSLTTPPARGKRGNAAEPQSTQKRHRVNALVDVGRLSSAAVSSDDSNDSISILQPNTLSFESSNTHVSNKSFEPKAAGITSSPLPPLGMAHTVTQTDAPMTVKKEKREETEEKVNARGIQQRSIKQESDRQTPSRNKSLKTEETIYCVDSDDEEVTQLLNRLSDALDQDIKCEGHDAVSRNSHGTSRTELPKDYRTLFKKAKQNINQLVSSRAALLEGAETKPSTGAVGEEDEEVGDITRQVHSLVWALDERTRERDQLRSQLASLERERKFLSSQRTDLRMKLLQQPREQTQDCTQTENRASSPDTYKSLIELRHNIGRLLVNFVPFLDLGQVNYECNVIDEILEQVVSDDKYSNWGKASCSNCTGR